MTYAIDQGFQFDPEAVEVRATWWISTEIPIYLFIYFYLFCALYRVLKCDVTKT